MKPAQPKGKISDVFGMLRRPDGPALSIEELNKAIDDGWGTRWARFEAEANLQPPDDIDPVNH